MAKINSVFISYRREVGGDLALLVSRTLEADGIDTFYDLESIGAAQFDTVILNQIAARPYFLPILTPGTLNRCINEGDWVRREIEHALKINRIIVPIYTPDFSFSDIDSFLPSDLAKQLKRWNMEEIVVQPPRRFLNDMRAFEINKLKPVELPIISTPADDQPLVQHIKRRAEAAILLPESSSAKSISGDKPTVPTTPLPSIRASFNIPTVFMVVQTKASSEVYSFPVKQQKYRLATIPSDASIGIVGRTKSNYWYYITFKERDQTEMHGWLPNKRWAYEDGMDSIPIIDYTTQSDSKNAELLRIIRSERLAEWRRRALYFVLLAIGVVGAPIYSAYVGGFVALDKLGSSFSISSFQISYAIVGNVTGCVLGYLIFGLIAWGIIWLFKLNEPDYLEAINTDIRSIKRRRIND